MQIEFNIEGIEKLVRELAPSLERPIKWLLLTTIVFAFSLPWIAGTLLLDRLLTPEQQQNPITYGYVAQATVTLFIAFSICFLIFVLYRQGGAYKRRAESSDGKLGEIKSLLGKASIDQHTRSQIEEILDDDE